MPERPVKVSDGARRGHCSVVLAVAGGRGQLGLVKAGWSVQAALRWTAVASSDQM